jgi:DNA-binding MarR family transcriptional regulator
MDLAELASALEAFAVLEPTALPLHHVQVFLFVALHGHTTYRQIEEGLNLSNASVSRTINALSDTHRTGRAGHRLLDTFKDPQEGRRLLVDLSARGQALLRQLQHI